MNTQPENWTPIDVSQRHVEAITGEITTVLRIASHISAGEFVQAVSRDKSYKLEVCNGSHRIEFFGVPVIDTEDGPVLALDKAAHIITKPADIIVEWIDGVDGI